MKWTDAEYWRFCYYSLNMERFVLESIIFDRKNKDFY